MEPFVAKCLSSAVDPGSQEEERSEEHGGNDRYDDSESAHAVVMFTPWRRNGAAAGECS